MWKKEAIPWLVTFAKTDVRKLAGGRPGDLANLFWDLRRFVNIQAPGPIEDEIRRAESEPSVLTEVIEIAKRLVNAVADREPAEFQYGAGTFFLNAAQGQPTRMVMSLKDAVLFSALYDYDLDEMASEQVRRCKECSEVFVAVRKDAIYCGRQCANTVAVRAYRQRRAAETAPTSRPRKPATQTTQTSRAKGDR